MFNLKCPLVVEYINICNLADSKMYFYERLYALPDYRHPDKLEEMKRIVLTKEPKVMSTAIREMRGEVEKLE